MLWKAHYSTLIVPEATQRSGAEARNVVGGYGPQDLGDMELWIRLIDSELALEGQWRLDLSAFSREDREDLIRASWIKRSLTQDRGEWRDEWPQRTYAYCPSARLLMIGPATEDAWDRFREAALLDPPRP